MSLPIKKRKEKRHIGKKVSYYGATYKESRKIKDWRSFEKVYSAGEQRRLIDHLLDLGYVVKVQHIYRASMIFINANNNDEVKKVRKKIAAINKERLDKMRKEVRIFGKKIVTEEELED